MTTNRFRLSTLSLLLLACIAPAQVRLIKNLNPRGVSLPRYFTKFGQRVVFAANDGTRGEELGITDGTSAGTRMIDVATGVPSSRPRNFVDLENGTFAFLATGASNRIYISNGFATGTRPLVYPAGYPKPGAFMSAPELVPGFANNVRVVYFFAAEGPGIPPSLWISDGTSGGTRMVNRKDQKKLGYDARELATYRNGIIYTARDSRTDQNYEPYYSDGTANGSGRIRDLLPGKVGSHPKDFAECGPWCFFRANTGKGDEVFWIRGASSAPKMIEIEPGPRGSDPNGFTMAGPWVYFAARTTANGVELWRTNTQTTVLVADINRGADSSNPSNILQLPTGDGVIFAAMKDTRTGIEPWVSKLAGTTGMLEDVNPNGHGVSTSVIGGAFRRFGTNPKCVWFAGLTGRYTGGIWRTDGDPKGTTASFLPNVALGVPLRGELITTMAGTGPFSGELVAAHMGATTQSVRVGCGRLGDLLRATDPVLGSNMRITADLGTSTTAMLAFGLLTNPIPVYGGCDLVTTPLLLTMLGLPGLTVAVPNDRGLIGVEVVPQLGIDRGSQRIELTNGVGVYPGRK